MYSDESMFRCVRATRKRVRRPVGSNQFDSWYIVKKVKHPASLMVWACFSGSYGRGGIFFQLNHEWGRISASPEVEFTNEFESVISRP
jgi:hypothetical protein